MTQSAPGRPLRRAVYLHANDNLVGTEAIELARKLNDAGAAVFVDEAYSLEAKREQLHVTVLAAMCHADEFVILYPGSHAQPRTTAPTFNRRDFLVSALVLAHIRGLRPVVLLPPGVRQDRAEKETSLPVFLERGEFFAFNRRQRYYDELEGRCKAGASSSPQPIHPTPGPRVCLVWVCRSNGFTTSERESVEALRQRLTAHGLSLPDEPITWTRPGGRWSNSYIEPGRVSDAVVVCASAPDGPWEHEPFRELIDRYRGLKRPVQFVQIGHDNWSEALPDYLGERQVVQINPSGEGPDPEILRLVRGAIGFKHFYSRPAGLTATNPPVALSQPVIPPPPPRTPLRQKRPGPHTQTDIDYVVYCRLQGVAGKPADAVAAVAAALAQRVEAICHDTDGVRCNSSVYGRFALVPSSAKTALDVAQRLLRECAADGVRLSVGVATGRVRITPDVREHNYASAAINLAARLANLPDSIGRISLEPITHSDATGASSAYPATRFTEKDTKPVKRTKVEYHQLLEPVPEFGPDPPPDKHKSVTAHVIVYDIVRFSEMDEEKQVRMVKELNEAVDGAFSPLGGKKKWVNSKNGWYAPAGDGGALVFRSGANLAWTFATRLLQHTRDRVEIRIGITTGPVALFGKLPIGPGIFDTDKLSGIAEIGRPCVGARFWDALDIGDRRGWTAEPTPDPDAVLVRPLLGGA